MLDYERSMLHGSHPPHVMPLCSIILSEVTVVTDADGRTRLVAILFAVRNPRHDTGECLNFSL